MAVNLLQGCQNFPIFADFDEVWQIFVCFFRVFPISAGGIISNIKEIPHADQILLDTLFFTQ